MKAKARASLAAKESKSRKENALGTVGLAIEDGKRYKKRDQQAAFQQWVPREKLSRGVCDTLMNGTRHQVHKL